MKKLLSLILIIVLGFTLYSTLVLTNNKLEKKNIKNNIKKVEVKIEKLKKDNDKLKVELEKISESVTNEMDEYKIWLKAKEKLEKAI